jgi:class 3 adenylate cyclase/CHASE2 domain-containing sensor protein
MTRIQRRLLIDTSAIGVTLTLFVAALDYFSRALQPLDDWFYDRRARVCQFFTPPPTDQLVHVDIDDQSLADIGRWPWHRARFARLLEEIDRAGAKAISLDIVLNDPSDPSPRPEHVGPGKYVEVDDDGILAATIRDTRKTLVPLSLLADPGASPLQKKLEAMLTADLELTRDECRARVLAEPAPLIAAGAELEADLFIVARRAAMATRVARELAGGDLPLDVLRARLLPRTPPGISASPVLRSLAEEYARVRSLEALRRFMLPIPPGLPPLARYATATAPIPPLSQAAAMSGYVDFVQTSENGVIRAIPLVAEHRGQIVLQTDLALACNVLGVDPRTLKFSADRIVIPRPPGRDRDVVIPVRDVFAPPFGRDVGMFMDIPVRGTQDWEYLYNQGPSRQRALHLSMGGVWAPLSMLDRIAHNNASLDLALNTILSNDAPHKVGVEPAIAQRFAEKVPPPHDTAERRRRAQEMRQSLADSPLAGLDKLTDAELNNDPVPRRQRDELVAANHAIDDALEANAQLETDLATVRSDLRRRIAGKAVMIGWAATGQTDFRPTAIQPSCPGVVIHGQVFNAIMTGEFWRHAPRWVTAAITLILGLLVTAANGFLKPRQALGSAVLLAITYVFINGLLLFDYGNTLVGFAGPIVAIGLVWSTGALAGFLIEAGERARITRRFSSYVDQKIVDYVIEHPETALAGQVREMSVIFTDLAGFTTLSERLRERSVGMLSEYLGLMVPVIRKHDGVLNKFLGDGIMCFFNAPYDDPDHAVHAVLTVLEMQKTMAPFARAMAEQGMTGLSMRCGVSTGNMVVGDSGPADYQDYTVLGDAVNFAARLEGANKATGTNILISQRTSELVGDKFLLRPVGRLLVVGKTEGLMTYEPLAPIDDATLEDRLLCASSAEMMSAYVARDFTKCIEVADQMDRQFGVGQLAALYRRSSMEYLANPPGDDFVGNLVLTEK